MTLRRGVAASNPLAGVQSVLEPFAPLVGFAVELEMEAPVNGIIYLVGLVVVVMFILSFLGLR